MEEQTPENSPSDGSAGLYRSLPYEDSFRVIQLQPAERLRDPVYCELEEGRLSDADAEVFSALSYVWGEWDGTSVIYCDNTPLIVTPSCVEALQYMRHETIPMPVWVDAVCINQQSIADKNHQVALMGQIYAKAIGVTAWFGEATKNTEEFFDYVRAVADQSGPEAQNRKENMVLCFR